MAAGLYQQEAVFQREVDRCSDFLHSHIGVDLRQLIYPAEKTLEQDITQQLSQTSITQPAIFVIEYALAKLLISWGIQPQAMIGHSIGEYVAACLAGVFSLKDALTLVAVRGRLIQSLPSGEMLVVSLSETDIRPRLGEQLSLAAVNGPALSVVSGPADAVRDLEICLAADGIGCRRLLTSHAFHSAMMDTILDDFVAEVKKVELRAPKTPFVSNLTGNWISAAEAVDPQYWAGHLRQTVRFADGIRQILQDSSQLFLEVGPGTTLSTLARQCAPASMVGGILSTLRHPQDQTSDQLFLLQTLGKLWLSGCNVNWAGYHAGQHRRRIPLPSYPFERQRYWLGSGSSEYPPASSPAPLAGNVSGVDDASQFTSRHPRPALLTAYVPPSTEMEQMLAERWEELLGIDSIGVQDNFFELGGHSLIATQLFLRLAEIYPVELPLRNLFETPTIAKLAETIEEKLIEKLEAMSEEEVLHLTNLEDETGANQ
jgi:acyl transferase domain-containing protein